MEKWWKFYLSVAFFLFSFKSYTQINCDVIDNENCRAACEIYNIAEADQGSNYSQVLFDYAIELCPNFGDAYREKAVPYLKRGDWVTWKKLIDKAVQIDSSANLGYRGWCRYQFLRDYKGAIDDFEKLGENLHYSQNGDYHLEIVKGICYSKIGNTPKGIEIIENQLKKKGYQVGLYDYYQLGLCYYESQEYPKALENFEKQTKVFNLAENIYYIAKIAKQRNENYINLKELALKSYDEGKTMKDAYTHHSGKIFRRQIEEL